MFVKDEDEIKAVAFTTIQDLRDVMPKKSHRISSLAGVFEDREDGTSNASKAKRVRISQNLPSSK